MNLTQNATKNIKGFLAYRIFFIVFILTTIPLWIYSIALYKAEYKQKRDDINTTLGVLANLTKQNIEENVKFKDQILNSLSHDLGQKNLNINALLQQKAQDFNLQNLFFIEAQGANLLMTNSSNSKLLGKNINFLKNVLNEKSTLFRNDLLECPDCIFYSNVILDQNQKPTKAIVLGFLQTEIVNEIAHQNLTYKIDLSIVDEFNKVIFSTTKNTSYLQKTNSKDLVIKNRLDSTKYYLILSVPSKYVTNSHLKSYFFKHTFVLAIVFILLIILSIFIIRILSKPVTSLLDVMKEIKSGNIDKRYTEHKMGFEINSLGNFFNEMMDSLIIQQTQIEKENIDKQKYIEELKIGKEIQLSLLPQKTIDIKGLDISFGNLFAKEVGGDFYDLVQKDQKLFFVIADIASKGILACLYALTLRSIIRSFVQYFDDLEKIIIETNKLFIKDSFQNSMFATAWFGVLDLETSKLKYSNCGHLPAILKKKEESLEFLTSEGQALGIEEFHYQQIKEISLEKNDTLFLYTDGIIDAINLEGIFFGQNHLENFIRNQQNLSSKQMIENLFDILKKYSKDSDIYDDMSCLIVKKY